MSDSFNRWEQVYVDSLNTLACLSDRDDLDDMRAAPEFSRDYAETVAELDAARESLRAFWLCEAPDLESEDIIDAIDEAGVELFGHVHWSEMPVVQS